MMNILKKLLAKRWHTKSFCSLVLAAAVILYLMQNQQEGLISLMMRLFHFSLLYWKTEYLSVNM